MSEQSDDESDESDTIGGLWNPAFGIPKKCIESQIKRDGTRDRFMKMATRNFKIANCYIEAVSHDAHWLFFCRAWRIAYMGETSGVV